jgi:1,4-alpha-glucan branching enzyme
MRRCLILLCAAVLGCHAQRSSLGNPNKGGGGAGGNGGGIGGNGNGDGGAFGDGGVIDGGIVASGDMSGVPGLGATPHAGGTTFRVWAPDSMQVFVAGDFNAWSKTANPLALESSATQIFGGDVPGAMAGQQYAYVLVAADGTSVQKADPRARQIVKGNGVIVDPSAFAWSDAAFTPPPKNAQVVYELHVGSFNNTAGSIGTFATVVPKLDYLQQLGVNMIEVMPPSQCSSETTWGYNPSWPYAIHDAYGAPDDFRALVDAAHARGIGVIVDVVYNHMSSKSPLWCWDGDCLGTGNGGAYFYLDSAKRSTPWGPRPDFSNANVRQWIADNVMMWMSEYHADGLRFDSVVSIRETTWNPGAIQLPEGFAMLQSINDAVHALPLPKLEVAEDLQGWAVITAATSAKGGGFDTQWDAGFYNPVDAQLAAASDSARDVTQIQAALNNNYNGVATERVVYTDDHDQDANGRQRMPSMIAPSAPQGLLARQVTTLGAGVVFTTPGIPMIFMGQEFVMGGAFDGTTPVAWDNANTYSGIVDLYRKLISLRRNSDGNTQGLEGNNVHVYHMNNTAKVIAYHRWDKGGAGDDVVVLANFSSKPFTAYTVGMPLAGTWHVRFASDDKQWSSDFTGTPEPDVTTAAGSYDGFAQEATFALGPYAMVILSQ